MPALPVTGLTVESNCYFEGMIEHEYEAYFVEQFDACLIRVFERLS